MDMEEKITASIVLYNTSNDLVERIISSYEPSEHRRLYIIDNSPLQTTDYLNRKFIIYIYTGGNLGYGRAHNIAIKEAIYSKAKYHIVLNPDIVFEGNVIDELKKYADQNDDVVYMLPKVIYPNGELQYLCKLLPTPFDLIGRRFLPKFNWVKKMDDRYTLKSSGYDKIMNPPCLSGCFMFMRVSTLEENHLFFDDRFFMYCEDFDLIRRLHKVGKTIYYPLVTIVHDHAHESYKNKKMLVEHVKSACKYFNKYGWFIDKERRINNQKMLKMLDIKGMMR